MLSFLFLALTGGLPAHAAPGPRCAPDGAGLKLPSGFCAVLVADSLGPVRHIIVAPNGDVIAAHRQRGVLLLRDTDGDGTADERHWLFEGVGGSGIALVPGALIFAANDSLLRIPYQAGGTTPAGPVVTIARDLPGRGHAAKGVVVGRDGRLFVSFGSLSNSCQKAGEDRRGPFPGVDPCPELPVRSGIWRFEPDTPGQVPTTAMRFATGMRNPMAMAVEPSTGTLYTAIHGRDNLAENWKWPAEQGRENPSEEFGPVPEGADYGWPYCFQDTFTGNKLQNPEYGGDGTKAGDCAQRTQAAIGFPAHWAPNALTFYTGTLFPAEYRGGAFLAFHGSWNRAPAPQQGYRVVFIPFQDGKPTGKWSDFVLPSGAETSIRPTGVAEGPDGSLYVSDDQYGKIWRVVRQ